MPGCRQVQPLNGLLFTLGFLRIIDEKMFIFVRSYFSMTFFLPRTRDEEQHVKNTERATQVDTHTHTHNSQSEPPPLTPHRTNGVAESIAQDPLLLVVQDKHAVHRELLGAGQGRPGVVVEALPEGDGLAPPVSVGVRRGSAMSLGLRHRVLPGGE